MKRIIIKQIVTKNEFFKYFLCLKYKNITQKN